MGRPRNTELDRAFAEAEECESCLALFDESLRSALSLRIRKREALLLAPRIYVRSEYWESLSNRSRMAHMIRALQAIHPDWVFCHESAAVMFDLPTASTSRLSSSYSVPRHRMDSTIR